MKKKTDKAGTDLKVLLLEDSPRDMELIHEQLSNAGYQLDLTHVENETGFTSSLHENRFDIILADFKLPGFDAFGALEISLKLCTETPFICVSGSIGEETAVELLKLGAVDYVLKDRPERLPMAVKRALEEAEIKADYQKALAALRQSEEKYRILVDSTLQGVVIAQAEPVRLVFANPAMTQLTGYSPEELTGMGPEELAKLIYEDDRKRFFSNLQKRIQKENIPKTNEYRIETKNGNMKWVAFYSSRIEYLNKPASLTTFMDITERKKAEEELIIKEKSIESSQSAIVLTNLNGQLTYVNRAFLKMWGYSDKKEVLEKQSVSFWTSEKEAQEVAHNSFETGKWEGELTAKRKDGTTFIALVSANLVADNEGKPMLKMASFIDITDRKQAEAAFKKSARQFQQLIETLPISLSIVTLSGEVLFINSMCQKLFELQDQDAPENRDVLIRWVNPDERAEWIEEIKTKGFVQNFEMQLKTFKGKHLWVLGSGIFVQYEGQTCVLSTHQDVTEIRKAQQALRESEEFNRRLLATIPDLVIRTDLKGNINYLNETGLANFPDVSKNDLIGRKILSFIHDTDQKMAIENTRLMLEKPLGVKEYMLKLHPHHAIDCEVNGDVVRDSDENPTGMVFVIRDITQKKKAEHELKIRIDELERFHRLTVGRELTMIELKKEVNALLNEAGKEDKYKIVE